VTFRNCFTLIIIGSLSLILTACQPSSDNGNDAKDLDYQRGKAYCDKKDYESAIASFRKALQHRPDNTYAHFQLGLVYEEKRDYIRAIYHYRESMESKKRLPEDLNAIKERISACTVKIVNNSDIVAVPPDYKHQIDLLLSEKRNVEEKLRAIQETYTKVVQANSALEYRVQILQKRERELVATLEKVGKKVELIDVNPTPNISAFPQASAFNPGAKPAATNGAVVTPVVYKKYRIQKGDTFGKIAKRYGVSEDRLLKINPGVDPRKLQIGQEVNIPG